MNNSLTYSVLLRKTIEHFSTMYDIAGYVQPILTIIKVLVFILPILLAVAFLSLAERKVLGATHRRVGPNRVGFLGLLQPIADAAKLILRETIVPRTANIFLFIIAPMAVFILSICNWVVIPLSSKMVLADISLGVLYIFTFSSLSVLAIILAGWASNSRYAFLGSLRAAAQLISYEVSIGLILVPVVALVGSLNLTDIVNYQAQGYLAFPLLPLVPLLFFCGLAETNRPPFDLPEAEGELVAGYNVEYSSIGFAFFFIGEYANILLISTLIVIFFFGGWNGIYISPNYIIWSFILSQILLLLILIFGISSITALISMLFTPFGYKLQTLMLIETNLLNFYKNLWHNTWEIPLLNVNILDISGPAIFTIKIHCVLCCLIFVRAAFPRYRYDSLMALGWKVFLPISLGLAIFYTGLFICLDLLPTRF